MLVKTDLCKRAEHCTSPFNNNYMSILDQVLGFQDLVAVANSTGPGGASLLMLNTNPLSGLAVLLCCGSLKEVVEGEDDEDNEDSDNDSDSDAASPRTATQEIDSKAASRMIGAALGLRLSPRTDETSSDRLEPVREETATVRVEQHPRPAQKGDDKKLDQGVAVVSDEGIVEVLVDGWLRLRVTRSVLELVQVGLAVYNDIILLMQSSWQL